MFVGLNMRVMIRVKIKVRIRVNTRVWVWATIEVTMTFTIRGSRRKCRSAWSYVSGTSATSALIGGSLRDRG